MGKPPIVFADNGSDLVSKIESTKKEKSGKFYLKKDKKVLTGSYEFLKNNKLKFHFDHLEKPAALTYVDVDELTDGLNLACEECTTLEQFYYYELHRTESVWWWPIPLRRETVAKVGPERINLDLTYEKTGRLAYRIFDMYVKKVRTRAEYDVAIRVDEKKHK